MTEFSLCTHINATHSCHSGIEAHERVQNNIAYHPKSKVGGMDSWKPAKMTANFKWVFILQMFNTSEVKSKLTSSWNHAPVYTSFRVFSSCSPLNDGSRQLPSHCLSYFNTLILLLAIPRGYWPELSINQCSQIIISEVHKFLISTDLSF